MPKQAEGVACLLHMLSEPIAGRALLRGTSNVSVESAANPASPLSPASDPASPSARSEPGGYECKIEGSGLEMLLARIATTGSDAARYAASRAICNLTAWKVRVGRSKHVLHVSLTCHSIEVTW